MFGSFAGENIIHAALFWNQLSDFALQK